MKKIFIGILAIYFFTGCGSKTEKAPSINSIFKEEFSIVSSIGESTGKILADEILIEEIEEVFSGIFDLAIFESSSIKYGEVVEGAGSDGNGGKVFCCKLPVNVNFTGSKEAIEKFVKYFDSVENVISFGEFNISELEDELFEVSTVITFLGKSTGASLTSEKTQFTIKKNEVEVEEADEIVLREFDISMVVRPSNSDAAAISLGVIGEKDYRVYSDENIKHEIEVIFTNEGKKYFCEYKIGNGEGTKTEIKPKGSILFDILSCEVEEKDDKISADLNITNNSNKKVSIITYDDDNGRINFTQKAGSIEVKKQ